MRTAYIAMLPPITDKEKTLPASTAFDKAAAGQTEQRQAAFD